MTSKADRFAAVLGTNSIAIQPKMVDEKPKTQPQDSDQDAKAESPHDVAPMGMKFAPIVAVSKLPYRFMGHGGKDRRELVAKQFFAEGKFWERGWDLWYVWSPHYSTDRPLVFVPAEQLYQLYKEIDLSLPSLRVRLPNDHEGSLTISFDDNEHPLLRPHFLGHSSNKDEFTRLINHAPRFDITTGAKHVIKDEDVATFKQTMEQAIDATQWKSKRSKVMKQEAIVLRQKDLGRQLERTQKSLGLFPPGDFENDIIYIAVDVESYERNHSLITEIGFATLDTRDLHDKSPGSNGRDWHSCIRGRHFRINEYKDYVNRDFVRGCPDSFMFGESEFVSIKDAPRVVASCFKPPFSDPTATTPTEDIDQTEKRQIIFLGHDTKQDVKYLRDLGYDPSNLSNLVEFLDTAAIYRAVTGEPHQRGLGHIMGYLELDAWNTHNAGNDAVYTMQALLSLCVKDLEDNKKKKKMKTEVDDTQEGGVKLPLTEQQEQQKKQDLNVAVVTEKFEEWEM